MSISEQALGHRLLNRLWRLGGGPLGIPVRMLAPVRLKGHKRLHLGCGTRILDGWANVDIAGGPGSIHLNLARRIPVSANSIAFVFSEHFIEHLPRESGMGLLNECFRVLEPRGVIRVSTPDLRFVVDNYLRGELGEWRDMGWNPRTPCQLMNEAMHLWGHQYLYDEAELFNALREAGFVDIQRMQWQQSSHLELAGLETRPLHHDLIVEASKPRR